MIPNFGQFPEGQILAFALILLRVLAFVVAMPAIGTQNVPVHVKVLFAVVLSILLFPTLKFANAELLQISDQIVFFAAREIFLGLFLGYLVRLFFFSISVTGDIVGISSGLASAQMMNPAMGSQSTVIEQFYFVMATLFFFGLNGHHIFISGLQKSFELMPIVGMTIQTKGFLTVVTGFQKVLTIGVKLASPVMISILLTNLAMGVLGRAVPQMNVFVTSLQVTFLITLMVLVLSVPFFVEEMNLVLKTMSDEFMAAMRVL